jgi:aromatic ring-opening dioxygenase catalytic subunit (LigB family)
MASRCVDLLKQCGFKAKLNTKFDWIHDTYLILIRMFPDGCPPTTIVSMNARYDPHYHMKVGSALRELRRKNVLFIGTGGAVHNLYRNNWTQMLRFRGHSSLSRINFLELMIKQTTSPWSPHQKPPSSISDKNSRTP